MAPTEVQAQGLALGARFHLSRARFPFASLSSPPPPPPNPFQTRSKPVSIRQGDKTAKMSAQNCLDVVGEIWEKKCEADAADKKAMNDPDSLVEFIEEHFLHK